MSPSRSNTNVFPSGLTSTLIQVPSVTLNSTSLYGSPVFVTSQVTAEGAAQIGAEASAAARASHATHGKSVRMATPLPARRIVIERRVPARPKIRWYATRRALPDAKGERAGVSQAPRLSLTSRRWPHDDRTAWAIQDLAIRCEKAS